MTEGYQGCMFFYNSHPRKGGRNEVSERKRRARERQMRRGGERKKRRGSKMLNLAIFLICAFLVALPNYAGVRTKQTVKLFSKTVLYLLIGYSMDNKTNTVIYFKYIS